MERNTLSRKVFRPVRRFFEGDPSCPSPIEIPDPIRKIVAKASQEAALITQNLENSLSSTELPLSPMDRIVIGDALTHRIALDKIEQESFPDEKSQTYMTAVAGLTWSLEKRHTRINSIDPTEVSRLFYLGATRRAATLLTLRFKGKLSKDPNAQEIKKAIAEMQIMRSSVTSVDNETALKE